MTSIEVSAPQEEAQKVPVNTRDIFITMMEESRRKGQDLNQPLADVLQHRRDADSWERLANEPTTDEMRLEKFGTPLPEGHPIAPHARKIGSSALR